MSFPWMPPVEVTATFAQMLPWAQTPAAEGWNEPLPLIAVPRDLSGPFGTSASRVEDFRLCRRKWAFNAIDGVPRAQNAAAALGDEVHKLREAYLIHGLWPSRDTRAGKIALAGMDKLPPPRLPLVEQKFSFYLGEIEFRGRIDFLCRNDGQYVWGERGIPLVGDHKTTSRDQYIKTPAYLGSEDPQAAIYGAYALALTGARAVDLHWSYMVKDSPPRGRQVHTRMSLAQVEDSFARVVNDAQEMLTLVRIQGIRAAHLEPNLSACEKFGGCPYKSVCPLTEQQRFGAFMNDMSSNFNNQQQQFANGQQPSFAPPQQQQQQFAPQGQQPGNNLTQVLQGQAPPVPQWTPGMQQGIPQTPPMQIQQAPQSPPQMLPPGVTVDGAGNRWTQQNGQWVLWSPQAAPQHPVGPIETPQEIHFAAQLVLASAQLPANATPGLVKAYSAFVQQPKLAQDYIAAASAHQQMQNHSAPPATGVVPHDAPQANTQSTTDETRTGRGGRPAGSTNKAPALKAEQLTQVIVALERCATAMERLAQAAEIANGGVPQPAQQTFIQQPLPQPTFIQQPGPTGAGG